MIPQRFLLTSSLKAFLLHDANALVELKEIKPLIEFINARELKHHWVTIALMKWEIHHGLKIDIEASLLLSIQNLVDHVLSLPAITIEKYMDHTLLRLRQIEETFEEHQWDDSSFDEEGFDRETYLGNKN
ncbi:MAG: hypothetical protein ABJI69_01050 [Balneola sp.]